MAYFVFHLALSIDPIYFNPSALASFLQVFSCRLCGQSHDEFKPHSLRICGHTFYTMHGVFADLRDFLTWRVINRCSLHTLLSCFPHRKYSGVTRFLCLHQILNPPLATSNIKPPPFHTKPSPVARLVSCVRPAIYV